MNKMSRRILDQFQVRKTKKQKEEFRKYIIHELNQYGYCPTVQNKGINNNIIIGNIEKAKIFFTAHYDTQAVLPFPNLIVPNNLFGLILSQIAIIICVLILIFLMNIVLIQLLIWTDLFNGFELNIASSISWIIIMMWMLFGKANKHTANDNTSGVITIIESAIKLPEDLRDDVCFVLFDNEELGLLGSAALAKEYKESIKNKLIINFDCVSDGNNIFFFPTKQIKNDQSKHESIINAFTPTNYINIHINKGFGFYPSDNFNFKYAYGVCSLKKGLFYYLDRIHTSKDIIFNEENIERLSDGVCKLVKTIHTSR